MAYLCGRPGCSEVSAATLQIDALAEMVSLVDARDSRDGVGLCARHADATTPPVGWAMNDLRSNPASRSLAAVPDEKEVPRSAPPRVRPARRPESIDRPGKRRKPEPPTVQDAVAHEPAGRLAASAQREVAPVADPGPVGRASGKGGEGPDSRPTRRRVEGDQNPDSGAESDSFPWHHQFEDDEAPSELQASSPLLSRAFRSTAG